MNLRPCPKCGGDASTHDFIEAWVECSVCGFIPTSLNQNDSEFSDGFHSSLSTAIRRWNRAVSP